MSMAAIIETPISSHNYVVRRLSGRLRRSTLVILRWTAIVGQTLALVIVSQVLGFTLPLWPCAIVIFLSIFVNITVFATLPLDRRVGDKEAAAQLGFDLIQLAVLLFLTGGMANPFSLLFLAPVVTGATTLSRPVFASLSVLAGGLSFALLFYHNPLPWDPAGSFVLPFQFMFGMWAALSVGTVFTSLYAWRAAQESRRMSEALSATEAVLAHEQKLSALGGLAAAAAHELGTPLATIQVTAKEMVRELDGKEPEKDILYEDASLMLSQARRCREILQQLAVRGDEGDIIHDELTLEGLLQESADPFTCMGVDVDIDTAGPGDPPRIRRQAELLFGLKNFIENAVDFAHEHVTIQGKWDQQTITIIIEDDGPGFDPAIRPRLGEPYVSHRPSHKSMRAGERKYELNKNLTQAGGLGLGVFISKTLIERTGGSVIFSRSHKGGAKIELIWGRKTLEM